MTMLSMITIMNGASNLKQKRKVRFIVKKVIGLKLLVTCNALLTLDSSIRHPRERLLFKIRKSFLLRRKVHTDV